MAIHYQENTKTFTLQTNNSSYQIKVDNKNVLLHTYYGAKIEPQDMSYGIVYADRGFSSCPYDAGTDRTYSLDALPQEYPCHGSGDFRNTALGITNSDNASGCDLRYVSHEIINGKYSLNGLPAVYTKDEEAYTLIIKLEDKPSKLEVNLYYGVIPAKDTITRSAKIINKSNSPITLNHVMSTSLDFLYGDFDLISFHGRHGMERQANRTPIGHTAVSIGSLRGTSSHQQNPFVILAEKDCNENHGNCYGLMLLYSGSFVCSAEKDQYNQTRAIMGVQSSNFQYGLEVGESFIAPEVAMVYSGEGLTQLSHNYHNLVRDNICRGPHKYKNRPIVLNNWEATYFNFNGEKLISMAKDAKDLGIEMLVLDDGWFSTRNSDTSGLGDWYVNEAKLGNTLENIVNQINDIGLDFGIWIEPEMVNENSDLYRNHPDWVLSVKNKPIVQSRRQMVLDFSNKAVVDYIFGSISKVLDSINVKYVKMDMNRSLCEAYSHANGTYSEGKVMYKYVLGVYDFMQRLLDRYPNLLLEGCSGGGGRYDAGMLYYSPQIWVSDNTDAVSRLHIQYGTSFAYPISTMSNHVSVVPNHETGRITDLKTRGVVAMSGAFGYELDITKLSPSEKQEVKQQIIDYKKYQSFIYNSKYYRLNDVELDREKAAWMVVADDKKSALLSVVSLNTHCNPPVEYVKLKGLNPNFVYTDNENTFKLTGSALMGLGLPVPIIKGEYKAWQLFIKKVD